VLVKRFAGERAWLEFEHSLDDGSRSLRDVLQAEAAMVRGTFDEIALLLRSEISVDPTFAPFAAWCERSGHSLTIVSSGIEAIIRDRLGAFDLQGLPVIANGIDADPAGWRILFRDPVPNGTDKAAIVSAARAGGARAIFVGDGRSDYAAAAAADVCYAKRGLPLERYLTERGFAFEPFSSFADIERSLRT
jgi:2-hydroxy-3-keto-5-methylthiopentenyl-1-phosphate phosphatase